ncbi:MAG: hypothetical protein JW774_08845 [Candidatus Aureabacteria bacterium]|nr:hypothetical protein [Candidatus Auribacterota bacterium]
MHFRTNQLLLYRLFLAYPNRAFYMHEIGKIISKKPGVFQKTLNKLEEDQFVTSEFKANARFFQLNPVYPFLAEIKSILKKMEPGAEALSRFEEKIRHVESIKKRSRYSGKEKIKQKKKRISLSEKRADGVTHPKLTDFQAKPIMTSLVPPPLAFEKPLDVKKKIPGKSAAANKAQLELF